MYFIILLLFFTTFYGIAYADTFPILVGDSHLIDGYYVDYDPNATATWTANPVEVYDNGTFAIKLRLDYLSENPTESKIYCPDCSADKMIPKSNLKLESAIALLKLNVEYQWTKRYDDWHYSSLTGIIPIKLDLIDDKSAYAFYEGTYELPKEVEGSKIQKLIMQISWVRVFVDDKENKFYQWMQAEPYSRNDNCMTNIIQMNDPQSVSGCFNVYNPIPEEFTSNDTLGIDYVSWIKENIKIIQKTEESHVEEKISIQEQGIYLSPKKQMELGIVFHDVQCKEGLERVIKSSHMSTACVKPSTAEKLIQRSWAIDRSFIEKCNILNGNWNYEFNNCVRYDQPSESSCEDMGGTLSCMSKEQARTLTDICKLVCEFE